MASYEDDHNLPPTSSISPRPPHQSRSTTSTASPSSPSGTTSTSSTFSTSRRQRLNLASFFQHASSPTPVPNPNNPPNPTTPPTPGLPPLAAASLSELSLTPLLSELITTLLSSTSTNPSSSPNTPPGAPPGYTDTLERVPKAELAPEDTCAICNCAFLDDPYPLVVRLPCGGGHVFDLECVGQWVKLQATCPLDREELLKKKKTEPPQPLVQEEGEEEEWDDNYG